MSPIDAKVDSAGPLSRARVWRSMTFCAVGALTGLTIAAYGLFTAQGTRTHVVPPENVATVNQRPVLRSDFTTQLETETGKPIEKTTRAEQVKVLGEMIREELLVQRGLELDFAETDQNARNALVASISDQAVAEVTTARPTDAQIRAFYDRDPQRWPTEGTMTLRELLIPNIAGRSAEQSKAIARDVQAALRAGTALEQVQTKYGLRELPRQDREFYFTVMYRLGNALFAAIRNLEDGSVSEPLAFADGIHLVQMIKNEKPLAQPFERVRSQVLTDYNTEAQARLMDNTLKFLKERATILIAPDYAKDYRP